MAIYPCKLPGRGLLDPGSPTYAMCERHWLSVPQQNWNTLMRKNRPAPGCYIIDGLGENACLELEWNPYDWPNGRLAEFRS